MVWDTRLGFNYKGGDPDVVMACTGGSTTLKQFTCSIHVTAIFTQSEDKEVINVVDLMRLQPAGIL